MRVMLLALEERIGKVLSPSEPVVQFIPEYAAYLMNRLEVGADGKTAHERAKGKKATVLGLEFAEKVLWKKEEGREDDEDKEQMGVWNLCGNEKKKWRVVGGGRKRRCEESEDGEKDPRGKERWGVDCRRWVKRVPWSRYKDDTGADGEILEELVVEAEEVEEDKET